MGYTQADTAAWFDRTYRTKGFRYLRPFAAYPIYLQLLDVREGEALLDVACGVGHLLRAARRAGLRATGVDVAPAATELAREHALGANVLRSNAERLPFADATFDYVTCIGSLERFHDRGAAIAEMQRVSRPDARFCIMVRNARTPAWRLWRRWLGRQNHEGHQDARSLDEWRELFEGAGFAVDEVLMDQWPRQRLRRLLRPRAPERERVARPLFVPLRFANEFIFLMRRR